MIAGDNSAVICARIESDIDAGDKGAGWIHRLDGPHPVFKPPEQHNDNVTFPLASISRRDLTYSCLCQNYLYRIPTETISITADYRILI